MPHPRKAVRTRASGREPSNMRRKTGLRLKRWALGSFLTAMAAPLVVLTKVPREGWPKNGRSVQIGGGAVPSRRGRRRFAWPECDEAARIHKSHWRGGGYAL